MSKVTVPFFLGASPSAVAQAAIALARQGYVPTILTQNPQDMELVCHFLSEYDREGLSFQVDPSQFLGTRVLLPLSCHEHRLGMAYVLELSNLSQQETLNGAS